jgi:NADH-quinone oxidoreductase subunit M
VFTPNALGIEGGIVQMLSHGVVSAALFMVVGVVYDRIHSREIADYGGLAEVMPVYAAVFMLFMMASVGLPGTSGFVGEILVIVGALQYSSWVAFFAATGMILSAAYMLWLYRRVIFGVLEKRELMAIPDLSRRELALLVPLALLVIWYGVQPGPILDAFAASTEATIRSYQAALSATKTAAVVLPLP